MTLIVVCLMNIMFLSKRIIGFIEQQTVSQQPKKLRNISLT